MISAIVKYTRLIKKPLTKKNGNIKYWEQRAKEYGRRSVLHIGHTDTEFDSVTQSQKETIFPYLQQTLRGNEQLILDFGCGPGRFTVDLATLTNGNVVGVDPIKQLLEMAPKHKAVQYKVMKEGQIPLPEAYIDVVWICLVLGGIREGILDKTIFEVQRVLKKGGLLFLVENTSNRENSPHWIFRTVSDYQIMFPNISLAHLGDYFDLGERISIMAGRKLE